KVQKLVIFVFGEALPSSLDGALHASILALNRLRNVDATELSQSMIDNTVAQCELPGLRKSTDRIRHVSTHGLTFRSGSALAASAFEISSDFRIADRLKIDIRNPWHKLPPCGE